jgi:hypothetical protein
MKVYLSSTFRDLHEHRAAVDRTLRKMGHDSIGMEQYAAESNRPVARCKRDVELADAYILILGWRYGYVPTDDNPDRRSITEIEYMHARQVKKPILAFLLDPEVPWPPTSMDSASADSAAASAIRELRSAVGAEHLVGMFSSPEDLASQVAAAVASLGLTTQLSEIVLNRTAVSADEMAGFGTGQHIDTSIATIQDMVANVGKDRALVVSLGEGDRWWSTRLFLLASLLRSLTLVRQIVFTGRGGHFAGMASPDALLDGLGTQFPVLELFIRQLRESESSDDRVRETQRQVDIWNGLYAGVGAAVRPAARRGNTTRATRPQSEAVQPRPEGEIQVGVREELLAGWLGERLITRCIEVQGTLTMSQVQQIVDCLVPDVPMELSYPPPTADIDETDDEEESDKTFTGPSVKVIDRDSFALQLAREWVRAGLPRNPAA